MSLQVYFFTVTYLCNYLCSIYDKLETYITCITLTIFYKHRSFSI